MRVGLGEAWDRGACQPQDPPCALQPAQMMEQGLCQHKANEASETTGPCPWSTTQHPVPLPFCHGAYFLPLEQLVPLHENLRTFQSSLT